ncbi:hypothetical protein A0H81_14218, partial [Grifola frondosa]
DRIISSPQWGFTPELKETKYKWKIIVKRVQDVCTNRRHDIKKAIQASVGESSDNPSIEARSNAQDIIALCVDIVAIHKPADLHVSLAMLARVAFIRQVYIQFGNVKNFWEQVDKELANVRSKNNDDEEKISRFFGRVLQNDRKVHGPVDLGSIPLE